MVHPAGHDGMLSSLGKGAVHSTWTRQKINPKSATEVELVALDDVLPQILWTRYFLNAQGYVVRDAIIHQDNQSAIKIEENGKGSSRKCACHMHIRCFFVVL